MASFLDSALAQASGSGGALPVADSLTVTDGCLVFGLAKWEGDGTQTCTMDIGAGTEQFSEANAQFNAVAGALSGKTFWWRSTVSGVIAPRMVPSSNVPFRQIRAISITPADKMMLVLQSGGVDADEDDTATDATPLSGPVSASGAGVSFQALSLFGSRTVTGVGSGWAAEPAEFDISTTAHLLYQLQSAAGDITADSTLSSAVEWLDQLAIFIEVVAPATRIPFRGSFGRRRGAYPL